jgi:ribosomal protein RSM22 (predicted rRNA methylase)
MQINTDIKDILNRIPSLINQTFPVPGKYRNKLPADIAELSRLLTNRRGDRSLSYLARPNNLGAYLHYFLPWNLYRLCLLLPSLNINLSEGSVITDLGCGPLTFASALWISRPDLRKIPMEINCIDRSGPALEAGKKLFTALCTLLDETKNEHNIPWKINLLKEDIDFRKTNLKLVKMQKIKKSSFVCAVNIFNEIYETISHNNADGLRRMAENAALLLNNTAMQDASLLILEPGIPQSGRFISLLRNELLKLGHYPYAPCTHIAACPFLNNSPQMIRGRNWLDTKKRWCHFSFETAGAPKELHRLSAAAKLPKERLVLSFLLTHRQKEEKNGARVISDAFPLPENKYGRYGCSEKGLILITGDKNRMENLDSLSYIPQNSLIDFFTDKQYDKKSGALIGKIK